MRRLTRWCLLICGGVLLFVLASGCAKFNLFYNAETSFFAAEESGREIDPRNQPTSKQKADYQRCIRKCELLIEEYPNSSYIDDALFFIGKSHYRLKEWSEAVSTFDNLLANFPNSKFVEEAMYLKSIALISRGDEDAGLEWFARLRESFPSGKFGVEALFRLGDAYLEKGRSEEAAHYYQQFLEEHPDHEARSTVLLSLGRSYYDAGDYEQAADVLEEVDPDRLSRSEYFKAEWLRLSALNRLGRADEAAAELPKLQKAAQGDGESARTMLLAGRILLAQGKEEEGLSTLESVALEFRNEESAGDATEAVVEYLLRQEGPTGERFRRAVEEANQDRSQRGAGSRRVRSRQQQLQRFDRYLESYESADSNRAHSAFRLAESYYIDFRRPETALEYYEKVLEEDPEDPLAPRAAYAIVYIEEHELGDSTAAEQAFARLIENYPDSPQARSLQGEVFLDAVVPTFASHGNDGEEQPGNGGPRVASAGGFWRNRARMDVDWPLRSGGPGAAQPRDHYR